MRTKGNATEAAKAALTAPRRVRTESPASGDGPAFLPTGCTLLNLALTGRVGDGWQCGKIENLIGNSSSGKTINAFCTFAEMARDPRFDDYRFIHDDVEAARSFDVAGMFGRAAADRVEAPGRDADGNPASSDTIQSFRSNVRRAIAGGRPFVYFLDSLDALTSVEELDKVTANEKAEAAGNKSKGTYGMEKAKVLTQILRLTCRDLLATRSTLVVISQTRDNVDPMSFEKYSVAGARALEFYSNHRTWLLCGEKHRAGAGKDVIGVTTVAKVKKNRVNGRLRTVEYPIFYSYGVDDIGSCVDWLVEHGAWPITKQTITAPGFKGTREALIRWIEKNGHEARLHEAMQRAWDAYEKTLLLDRKPRY